MKTSVIIGYITSLALLLTGVAIAVSIIHSPIDYLINSIMSGFFVGISFLFFYRASKTNATLTIKDGNFTDRKIYFITNISILLLEFTVAVILLLMAIYRALVEKMTVFG